MASVGLISDTHGWLHPAIATHFAGVDHIIHAGDIGRIEVTDALETIAPLTAVYGNIDGGDCRFFPETAVLEVAGKRIAVLHIAGNPYRPKAAARRLIAAEEPDVIVVGHSHLWVVGKVGETLWLNPGAAGNSGIHKERTAAILRIDESTGELGLDRVNLGPRGQGAS